MNKSNAVVPAGKLAFFSLLLLCLAASATAQASELTIKTENLSQTVKVLASDEFEGRAPGGAGEDKTVAYLIKRFKDVGLKPGGENGGWTQSVPLYHTQLPSSPSIQFNIGDLQMPLGQENDIALGTVRPLPNISIDKAPVVFVGFGASAPERGWDDYGDIDLAGKVAIYLVNDPDFAAAQDEPVAGLFGGKRMTYYGRWAYKFEEAARRGALGALVIHEDKAAGYGWNVASSSPGAEYSIARPKGAQPAITVQGWLHNDAAAELFASAGLDLNEQRILARRAKFEAFELPGVSFSTQLEVAVERIDSQNVLAILPGSTRPDETIMVSAHWDAFGQGQADSQGRTVRPGANDDALGTAGVIELARVLAAGEPLQRSVVFAAWTAEESGLLGSAAYAANPVHPLETTVANFTLDILQTAGLARDVILVGEGQSDLENDLASAAALQGRVVTAESLPENGLFFRADHFSLARSGVPVLLIMAIAGGSDLIDGGRAAGEQWIADYIGNCYHQTCDAWDPGWDLRGAAQDVELFHTIIKDLGNSARWPSWKSGSEFKAVRELSDAMRSTGPEQAVARTVDDFHAAASRADQDAYLGLLTEEAVFLGTDGTERWQGKAFRVFVESHFSKGQGWTYTPTERHVTISASGDSAWFDEMLAHDSLGVCRGSGALQRTADGWRIAQYNLSVPIPNSMVGEVAAEIVATVSEAD